MLAASGADPMSLSSETVVSVLIGGLISGVITWVVAHLYFRKQEARAEQMFDANARFLEMLSSTLIRGGPATLGFERDGKGRIINAKVDYSLHLQTAGLAAAGTGHVTPPADTTRTKGGQNDDLMS